jgi:hypothetical protein
MLKREIKYVDWDGVPQVEVAYFHLAKSELVEMAADSEEGLDVIIRKMVASADNKQIVALLKRVIRLAYGRRSDDGKRFTKTDDIQDEFMQSQAYDALFMDLITNEQTIADFLLGILPTDLGAQVQADMKLEATPILPPPSMQLSETPDN